MNKIIKEYRHNFEEAIKFTESIGAKLDKINEFNSFNKRYISKNSIEKIGRDLRSNGIGSFENAGLQCLKWHHALKKIVEQSLNIPVVLTIGQLYYNDTAVFSPTKADCIKWFNNGVVDYKGIFLESNSEVKINSLNLHVWYTLPSMEIIDLTIATTLSKPLKNKDLIGLIVGGTPDKILNNHKYVPVVLGEHFLETMNSKSPLNLLAKNISQEELDIIPFSILLQEDLGKKSDIEEAYKSFEKTDLYKKSLEKSMYRGKIAKLIWKDLDVNLTVQEDVYYPIELFDDYEHPEYERIAKDKNLDFNFVAARSYINHVTAGSFFAFGRTRVAVEISNSEFENIISKIDIENFEFDDLEKFPSGICFSIDKKYYKLNEIADNDSNYKYFTVFFDACIDRKSKNIVKQIRICEMTCLDDECVFFPIMNFPISARNKIEIFDVFKKEIDSYQLFMNKKQGLLRRIFNRNKIEFNEDEHNQKEKIFWPIIKELNNNINIKNVYNKNRIILKQGIEPKLQIVKI